MADDWGKLEADYKKLEPQIKRSTLAQASKLWQALLARDKLMDGHEKMLSTAALAAYEKGVKGKTLVEFLKDKAFADAKKLLDTDRRFLVNELFELKIYCEACAELAKPMDKLSEVMAKAIKSTKDESPARTKVKKLREELTASLKDVNEASALRFKPDKYMTSFNMQFDKLIDHLLAEALKKATDKKEDDDELPLPLGDKKLKGSVDEAQNLRKAVEDNLSDALSAKEKDPKTVAAPLKKATLAMTELKKLHMRYQGLRTKFKKDIATSKEPADIEKPITEISAEFAQGEKSFKEAMAKLKK